MSLQDLSFEDALRQNQMGDLLAINVDDASPDVTYQWHLPAPPTTSPKPQEPPAQLSQRPPLVPDSIDPDDLLGLGTGMRRSTVDHLDAMIHAMGGAQALREDPSKIKAFFKDPRNGFHYDLSKAGQDLGGFLVTRRGHCELFATTTVLLLRRAGLPARYVTGFWVQEWTSPQTMVARGSDAHAWTQVFANGHWQNIETTPPADPETTATDTLSTLKAALHRWWRWARDGLDDQLFKIKREGLGLSGKVGALALIMVLPALRLFRVLSAKNKGPADHKSHPASPTLVTSPRRAGDRLLLGSMILVSLALSSAGITLRPLDTRILHRLRRYIHSHKLHNQMPKAWGRGLQLEVDINDREDPALERLLYADPASINKIIATSNSPKQASS